MSQNRKFSGKFISISMHHFGYDSPLSIWISPCLQTGGLCGIYSQHKHEFFMAHSAEKRNWKQVCIFCWLLFFCISTGAINCLETLEFK